MSRLWKLVAGAFLGITASIGLASTSGATLTPPQTAHPGIGSISAETPLYLQHAADYRSNVQGATRVDHDSHTSHESHSSMSRIALTLLLRFKARMPL